MYVCNPPLRPEWGGSGGFNRLFSIDCCIMSRLLFLFVRQRVKITPCPLVLVIIRSLIFRRNSAQITRSRGNFGDKSDQFAPMSTHTQRIRVQDAFSNF